MRSIIKNLLLIILSTALIACGYTLRGNLNLPDDVKNIALITDSYSPISSEINLLLTNIGVETSDSKTTDGYQIEIVSEIPALLYFRYSISSWDPYPSDTTQIEFFRFLLVFLVISLHTRSDIPVLLCIS